MPLIDSGLDAVARATFTALAHRHCLSVSWYVFWVGALASPIHCMNLRQPSALDYSVFEAGFKTLVVLYVKSPGDTRLESITETSTRQRNNHTIRLPNIMADLERNILAYTQCPSCV